jgi:hypothetical protein
VNINKNYILPYARPVLVQPTGDSRPTFGTLAAETKGNAMVNFPQCELVPNRVPELIATEVPEAWVKEPSVAAKGVPDLDAMPEVRRSFAEFLAQTGDAFPGLKPHRWEALEAASPEYNCISNTLGVKHQLPGFGFQDLSLNVQDYGALYLSQGFLPLDQLDTEHHPEIEKVVIFGHSPSNPGYWDVKKGYAGPGRTIRDHSLLVGHGARQESDGLFSHKMGQFELIATSDPADVAGRAYGQPIAVFARQRLELAPSLKP